MTVKTPNWQVRIALVCALAIALAFAWSFLTAAEKETPTVRFEVKVEVEHKGQIYIGRSVQEMRLNYQPYRWEYGPGGYLDADIRGEAVRVDLPNAPPVYVLMAANEWSSGDYPARILTWCGFSSIPADYRKDLAKAREFARPCRIPTSDAVAFQFLDMSDPTMVSAVTNCRHCDPKLIDITLTKTTDEVTAGRVGVVMGEDQRIVVQGRVREQYYGNWTLKRPEFNALYR